MGLIVLYAIQDISLFGMSAIGRFHCISRYQRKDIKAITSKITQPAFICSNLTTETLEKVVRFFVLAIKMQVSRSYSRFVWFDVIARLSTFPHRFQAHPLFLTHLSSSHEAVKHLVSHSKRKKNLRSLSSLRFPFSRVRIHQKSA